MCLCNVVLCAFDCCGVVQQQQLRTESHESTSISLISFLSQTLPPYASAINTFLVYQGGEGGGAGSRHLDEPQPPRAPPPTLQYPHPPPPSFEGFQHQQFLQHTTDFQQLYGQLEKQGFPTPIDQSQAAIKKQSTLIDGTEYANKMGDNKHQSQASSSSRLALRNAGIGEIVEVQGGHVVRSIGRKDRHSKVFTAKGPRDRRVRLSAHTAIQFYDVQDRLGYDRSSKVVDWLLKKTKPAIDELPELPPWKPTATIIKSPKEEDGGAQPTGSSDEVEMDDGDNKGFYTDRQDHQQQQQEQHHQQNCNNADSCGLLPPLDSDAIADTIKSSFPMGCTTHHEVSAATSSSPPPLMQFSSYMPELMSRSHSHSQDLRLSLQSFRETMMMQSHPHHHHQAAQHSVEEQPFFPGAASHLGFNHQSAGWTNNQPAEMGRFQRLLSSFPAGNDGSGGGNAGGGGFMLNSSPPSVTPMLQPSFFGQLLSQGGTLQSSYNPLIRAWINDPSISNSVMEQTRSTNPYPVAGTGSAYTGGFSGFHIPARIQGEEEYDGDPNKPSSTPFSSRH